MTIDEAIEVFEADTYETILNLSELRSDELAKWLTELKAYRCYKDLYEQGRADAIEEFLKKEKECQQNGEECPYMHSEISCVECIAENLKEQNND